jgi:predicted transporter
LATDRRRSDLRSLATAGHLGLGESLGGMLRSAIQRAVASCAKAALIYSAVAFLALAAFAFLNVFADRFLAAKLGDLRAAAAMIGIYLLMTAMVAALYSLVRSPRGATRHGPARHPPVS